MYDNQISQSNSHRCVHGSNTHADNYAGSRSVDYPFGILELDLKADEKGKEKGEGSLIYAAQIKVIDGDKVDIENLTFAPIRLLGVQQL